MKTEAVLTKSLGLKTTVDPVRIAGTGYLSATKNVEIDESGRISRRKGYTRILSGAWHSLYAGTTYMLGVKGDAFSVILPNSFIPIRNVTENLHMSYAKAWDGKTEIIYHANGKENGKVINGIAYPFSIFDYIGPKTSRTISVMDGALKHLTIYAGRLFASENNTVWYSEPFWYDAVDKARNFWLFEGLVVGLMPIKVGLVVGTTLGIYLIQGELPDKVERVLLSSDSMIEWSQSYFVNNAFVIGDIIVQDGWIIGTSQGIVLITNAGEFFNLTSTRIVLPTGISFGASVVFKDKLLMTLEG